MHGQKTFNGVALFSKLPLEDVSRAIALAMMPTSHARFLEAVVIDRAGSAALRLRLFAQRQSGRYAKNMHIKSAGWTDLFIMRASALQLEEPLVPGEISTSFPTELDARFPDRWVNDALFLPAPGENSAPFIIWD